MECSTLLGCLAWTCQRVKRSITCRWRSAGLSSQIIKLIFRTASRITAGQRRTNMSADQTRNIVKMAARRPMDRINGIKSVLREANFNNNPILDRFGIKIANAEIKVRLCI